MNELTPGEFDPDLCEIDPETECIYLGMLLHFLNNLTSLVLSYISGGAEYISLFAILVIFVASTALLVRTNLFADIRKSLELKNLNIKEVITPALVVFCVCAAIIL